MAENMMNSYFKSTNDVARKNHMRTFTFSKKNKNEVDDFFSKHNDIQEYVYNSTDMLEEIFGSKVKVVLEYLAFEDGGEELSAFIQMKNIHVENMDFECEKLTELSSKRNKFDPLLIWRINFIDAIES